MNLNDILLNAADLTRTLGRDWLTPQEAAQRLGFSEKTLRNWRVAGRGPAFRKPSVTRVQYPIVEVLRWQMGHPVVHSTTEIQNLTARG